MNDRPPHQVSGADEAERRQARLLAEALDAGATAGVDPETLMVVRLLEAVSESPEGDELASRRLRRRLVDQIPRASRLLRVRAAVAAGLAAAVVLGVLLARVAPGPAPELVAERERVARDAVAEVAGSQVAPLRPGARVASVLDDAWRTRFDTTLRSERFAALSGDGSAGDQPAASLSRTTTAAPTPGGVS